MTLVKISALAALIALAACSPKSEPAAPVAAQAATPASDIFRFKIGTLDAVALKDGDIREPNDGRAFGVGRPPSEVSAVLQAAGLPTDVIDISIQPLLVSNGRQVLLFDTGAAGASFAKGGRLPASLRTAGVEPAQVTDIFISHGHLDHVGGLVGRDGILAFPNATIHVSAPEWTAMKADTALAAMIAVIAPKVVPFEPDAVILPGLVTAVDARGHTPGHSAYEIASGAERLLYIGDTAHHSVISVQKPGWTIDYDGDPARARASRIALLERAADENLHLYAVHFPFPGVGHVRRQGESFVWIAD